MPRSLRRSRRRPNPRAARCRRAREPRPAHRPAHCRTTPWPDSGRAPSAVRFPRAEAVRAARPVPRPLIPRRPGPPAAPRAARAHCRTIPWPDSGRAPSAAGRYRRAATPRPNRRSRGPGSSGPDGHSLTE
ncbi:hypothetical protein TSH58_12080 [Azospirillum sp. TSH58]|nr:hypothetical protein TSH58_12080 [Azospirillum sp. TSH58]